MNLNKRLSKSIKTLKLYNSMIFDVRFREDEFIKKGYEKAMKELNDFFEINWQRNKPKIFLMADRKTIDEHRQAKTEKWNTGYVSNNDLFILAPENYNKESTHNFSEKEYFSLIKHELAHLFELVLSKNKKMPDWIWEGLALYLAGQVNDNKKPPKLSNFLDYYDKSGKGVYAEAGFAVKFLIEKYGKEKILKLLKEIKNLNSKEDFYRAFKAIYGFDLDYKNFNISSEV